MIASQRITVPVEAVQRSARIAENVGRVCSGLAVLFLVFDTVLKVLRLGPAIEGTTALGFPADSVQWIGIVELACVVIHVVPRTSVFGGLLLTGYLGGAVAAHVRNSNPLLTHTLFPVYVALLLWGGLYLREKRLRDLVPLRRRMPPPV
jgi:DoxX-like protein